MAEINKHLPYEFGPIDSSYSYYDYDPLRYYLSNRTTSLLGFTKLDWNHDRIKTGNVTIGKIWFNGEYPRYEYIDNIINHTELNKLREFYNEQTTKPSNYDDSLGEFNKLNLTASFSDVLQYLKVIDDRSSDNFTNRYFKKVNSVTNIDDTNQNKYYMLYNDMAYDRTSDENVYFYTTTGLTKDLGIQSSNLNMSFYTDPFDVISDTATSTAHFSKIIEAFNCDYPCSYIPNLVIDFRYHYTYTISGYKLKAYMKIRNFKVPFKVIRLSSYIQGSLKRDRYALIAPTFLFKDGQHIKDVHKIFIDVWAEDPKMLTSMQLDYFIGVKYTSVLQSASYLSFKNDSILPANYTTLGNTYSVIYAESNN